MLGLLAEQHEQALDRLPPDVYDYYASGAGDEVATAEAERAWLSYRLRPRVLRDVAHVDLSTTLLGAALAVALATNLMLSVRSSRSARATAGQDVDERVTLSR